MKLFVLCCLLACAAARSPVSIDEQRQLDRDAQITSYTNENLADGSNENAFTSDNGIERQEKIILKQVEIKNADGKKEIRVIPIYKGVFKYQQEDGTVVERRYTTDERGTLSVIADDLPQSVEALPVP